LESIYWMKYIVFGYFLLVFLPSPSSTQAQQSFEDSLVVLLSQIKNKSDKIDTLLNVSRKLVHNQPSKAYLYAKKALTLAEELKDLPKIYEAHSQVAEVYWVYGDYEDELKHLGDALKIAQKLKNNALLSEVLTKLANVHIELKNYQKAFDYTFQALDLAKKMNDQQKTTMLTINLGDYYHRMGDDKKAIAYTQQALRFSKKIKNNFHDAFASLNMAMILNHQRKYEEAVTYAQNALLSFQRQSKQLYNLYALIELGIGHGGLKKYNEAYTYFDKALKIALSLKAKPMLIHLYHQLSILSEQQNNFAESLRYHKLHKAYSDSIYNDEKSKQLAKIQGLIEVENQNQTIEHLTQKNESQEQILITRTYSFFAILASIVVVLLVLYINNLQKQKVNKVLFNQNVEILKQQEKILKQQNNIEKKNKMLELQNYEINLKNGEIEEQNKDITDSIEYAQRIQQAILPTTERIIKALPEHFILFKPKDIVSGDFYWFYESHDKVFISAIDCTGHGVPGAFMSLIANDLLNNIIINRKIEAPDIILKELHHGVRYALNQSETQNKDGMDITLCVIDKKQKNILFSGAYNPLVYFQDNEFVNINGDNNPIGGWHSKGENRNFTVHTIDIQKPTMVYMYSDGYQDQFGGKDERKFMKSRLRKLLTDIHSKSMGEQKQILNQTIEDWKSGYEQVDDILVIGFRV
jgi:serine phosphatase RsbU (regulator of sigma subunit)